MQHFFCLFQQCNYIAEHSWGQQLPCARASECEPGLEQVLNDQPLDHNKISMTTTALMPGWENEHHSDNYKMSTFIILPISKWERLGVKLCYSVKEFCAPNFSIVSNNRGTRLGHQWNSHNKAHNPKTNYHKLGLRLHGIRAEPERRRRKILLLDEWWDDPS